MCVAAISDPISPYQNAHMVVILSYVPRLGRASTKLTSSPAMRPLATCGFSLPSPLYLPSVSKTSHPTFPLRCPIASPSLY